jgi:hypothetical protein
MAKEFREVRDPSGIDTDDMVSRGIAKPIQTVDEFRQRLMNLTPEELSQLAALMTAAENGPMAP